VARALLLAETAPQQVATLIALRQGGDSARRLWALIGGVGRSLADVGWVAVAPHDAEDKLEENTQGVSQADISSSYDVASPIRLWTLKPAKSKAGMSGFAIRPLGNSEQNLNAWDKKVVPQTQVGIFSWKDGQGNEVWTFNPVA